MQSPSFNRYSSSMLEDVAARVVAEFPDHFENDTVFYLDHQNKENNNENEEEEEEEEEENEQEQEEKEFEFPTLLNCHVALAPPLAFPVFGRDIIITENKKEKEKEKEKKKKRSPLWKLMREEKGEERESCSSSSSEGDELEGVAEESYCVWTPATAGKSLSAGRSSRRWRVRDLLLFRSNSDGVNIR